MALAPGHAEHHAHTNIAESVLVVVLVSDLAAIREVVQDGEEVLLCSPSDVEDWIVALEKLAQDPELRGKLGRNALSTLLRRYTWDQRAAGILEAIAA